MTLYSDVNSNDVHGKLEASTADFNLFEKALIFAENSGLEQISGRMGSTDRNGDLSGACILGQFTEHYRQGNDPDANWTYRRGMYDTYGNGLPLMVRQAYGLSSENLLVDL